MTETVKMNDKCLTVMLLSEIIETTAEILEESVRETGAHCLNVLRDRGFTEYVCILGGTRYVFNTSISLRQEYRDKQGLIELKHCLHGDKVKWLSIDYPTMLRIFGENPINIQSSNVALLKELSGQIWYPDTVSKN